MRINMLFSILTTREFVQAAEPTFTSVLVNVPEFQQGIVQSLSNNDVRKLASTNKIVREIMETPYIFHLRIQKYIDHLWTFDTYDTQEDYLRRITTLPISFSIFDPNRNSIRPDFICNKRSITKQYTDPTKLYHDLMWLQKHRMDYSDAREILQWSFTYHERFLTESRGSDRSKFFIRQTKLQLYLGVLNENEYNERIRAIQNRFIPTYNRNLIIRSICIVLLLSLIVQHIPFQSMRIFIYIVNSIYLSIFAALGVMFGINKIHVSNIQGLIIEEPENKYYKRK